MSVIAQVSFAQTSEWNNPVIGYASTEMMTIEKVEFSSKETMIHAAIEGRGSRCSISSHSYLSVDGRHYEMKKIFGLKADKAFDTPLNGKKRFRMAFNPVPVHTKLMHFVESEADEGWRLCNIREKKEDLQSKLPDGWDNIAYNQEIMLPKSIFCDDSTKIHVKILNYTPEAATDIRLSYPVIDIGTNALGQSYPISQDGTSEIKLHPCFPLTVYMQIGNGPKSPMVVEPGKDASVLIDLGNANDAADAMRFKGNLAQVNYEINGRGGKNKVAYRNDRAYYDSLYSVKTNINAIIKRRISDIELSYKYSGYQPATQQYIGILNTYALSNHCSNINNYIARKIKDKLKQDPINDAISNAISSSHFTYMSEMYERMLLTSDRLTICPYFTTAPLLPNTFVDEKFKGFDGVTNTYNKDIYTLCAALFAKTSGYNDAVHELINDSTLKAYYFMAAERWEHGLLQMNECTNVHISGNANLRGDELRRKIMDEYAGKIVVFVAFNRKRPGSMKRMQDVYRIMKQDSAGKTVFIMVDFGMEKFDCHSWYGFATQHDGEYYADMNRSYLSLFESKYEFFNNDFYYMVYGADGSCLACGADVWQLKMTLADSNY